MSYRVFFGSVLTLFFVASTVFLPFFLYGHGTGESFEKEVDGHVIDIAYNVTEFIAGSTAVFEFDILRDEKSEDFSDVWVRIVKGNKTVFASGIYNAEFGGARMTYSFPEEGVYELSVRFQNGSDSIAESAFPVEVLPNPNGDSGSNNIVYLLIAGVLGLAFGAALPKIMKR